MLLSYCCYCCSWRAFFLYSSCYLNCGLGLSSFLRVEVWEACCLLGVFLSLSSLLWMSSLPPTNTNWLDYPPPCLWAAEFPLFPSFFLAALELPLPPLTTCCCCWVLPLWLPKTGSSKKTVPSLTLESSWENLSVWANCLPVKLFNVLVSSNCFWRWETSGELPVLV